MKRIASILILLVLCAVARGQVKLDGVNDYINYGDNDVNGSETVSFWLRLDKDQTGMILSKYVSSSDRPVYIYNEYLRIRAFKDSSGVAAASSISLYTWYHFVVTYDASTLVLSLYQDGGLSATASNVPNPGVNNANLLIGVKNDNSAFICASILDMRVYARALSSSEVSEIYHNPWALAEDPSRVLRTCVVTNDTGTALTGVARNYGTGADGTYSNSPTAAQPHVQTEKPLTMELP